MHSLFTDDAYMRLSASFIDEGEGFDKLSWVCLLTS